MTDSPRRYALPALCALLICAALWPTLGWVELSSGSEQLVVGAVLESQRNGSWEAKWLPSLNGAPRVRKPPLTTWLGMLAVPTSEARALAEGPVDDAAFRVAAIKLRTVSLFCGGLLLLGAFELGRVLRDRRTGLAALAICGSTFFWLEQSIRLTTDVTLALFVVWANVGFAHALLRGRTVAGLAFAGAMMGLGFLSKGPVSLVQTAAPALVMLPFLRSALFRPASAGRSGFGRNAVGTILCLLLFALIALPWFADVLLRNEAAARVWQTELLRTDEDVPPSEPWTYLAFFALVVPWTPFILLGLLTAIAEFVRRLVRPLSKRLRRRPTVRSEDLQGIRKWLRRGGDYMRRLLRTFWKWLRRGRSFARLRGPGLVYALLMVLVPVAIMLLFRDKKDRYLLPMLAPACVLAAEALRLVVRDAKRRPKGAAAVFAVHWTIVGVMAVGLPIATMFLDRNKYDTTQQAWLSPTIALPLVVAGVVLWLGSIWLWRSRGTIGLVGGTVACVLFAGNAFLAGYGDAREATTDLKPIAEVIRREVPSAVLWHDEDNVPPGLLIYAGRTAQEISEEVAFDRSVPNVFIVRQRRADHSPEPVPPPPWSKDEVLTTARRDRSVWWAFVLPPGSP